ncbi:helix-turn-helix transcriptional regulator [Microvirga aerilata]|uniref:Helix-turn-helix transcriptional regulator n=1 Tax=Microvirga aerilata TaxID=670292 RepID=A0A936ZFW6_9HYPH|nr:helix-turn-helix transcriptional regulator [Microvirga aerilata]MBL0403763.1 helix-turn-helix transcriptional regulator [Microvirga aerilata]
MIETPAQFQKWRKLHDLTQSQAAELLGLSRRSIATYESTGPVPRTVALACEAITNEPQNSGFYVRLVEEQYPKLGPNLIVLPFVLRRASTYEQVIQIRLLDEVEEWLQENTPSAQFSLRTVITPEMRRREVAVFAFESIPHAVLFKLRWC